MAVEPYGTARNTLFLIKSTECGPFQGDQGIVAANPTKIPPLGTIDADANPTSETDILPTTKGVNFLRSQAVMGAFQFIEGKSAVSIQVDNEKFDFQDLNSTLVKRQFFKGGETMSGTIELGERREEMIWMGATLGEWNSLTKEYNLYPHYRHFEIWCAVNPDVLDTTFTKCDILYKLMNVSFDNVNANFENPIKHSVPFSFSDIRIFMRYNSDVGVDGKGVSPGGKNGQTMYLSSEYAGAAASGLDATDLLLIQSAVGPDNAPNGDGAHTRLLLAFKDPALDGAKNGSLEVIIKGRDPYGQKIESNFFIADLSATIAALGSSPIELLTNEYYDGETLDITLRTKRTDAGLPSDAIFSAVGSQVLDILSTDWKSQEGIPIIEV